MLISPIALSSAPAGVITEPTEIDTLLMQNIRLPAEVVHLADRLRGGNFGAAATTSTSAPEPCNVVIWLSIVGSVGFVGGLCHHLGVAVAELTALRPNR